MEESVEGRKKVKVVYVLEQSEIRDIFSEFVSLIQEQNKTIKAEDQGYQLSILLLESQNTLDSRLMQARN